MMRMFNRQKVLLNTIDALHKKGIHSRRAIVKSQFLLKEECDVGEQIKFYHFFAYKQGHFSHLCYHDLRSLRNEKLIDDNETKLTKDGETILAGLNNLFNQKIANLLDRFSSEKEMTVYIYKKYPSYTVKSELIAQAPQKQTGGYFTIGYEGKDIDAFLNILIKNKVNMLIDVRKNPFSMNFSYVKATLKKYLDSVGIEYLHIPELGIESEDRRDLKTKEDYELLFAKYRKRLPLKEVYINRIIELGKRKKIALLCYEKDHDFCHRGQIASAIRHKKYKVTDL